MGATVVAFMVNDPLKSISSSSSLCSLGKCTIPSLGITIGLLLPAFVGPLKTIASLSR